MPDLKLSQLVQIQFSDLVSNDLIPVVQIAAGTAGSKVILAGGIIAALSGKQASSAELTGLSGLSATGFVRRTGAGSYSASFLSPSDIPSDAVSNVNVVSTAAIAWSKISKVGAVPADVGAIGYSAFSATSPLSYNSGTGQFSIQQANGTQPGSLSAADWTTFNGKQSALGFTPLNPGNNLSDLSNLATARTNLSLVPGTDVQAYSARLNDIVSLFSSATNGFFLRKNAGGTALEFAAASNGATWGAITGTLSSQTDLNTALGGKQGSSAELTGVAALSTTGVLKRTGAGTYTAGSLIASDIPSSSIDNSKVATSAAIAWSKIDKTGAVAADVGAIGLSGLSATAPLSYNSGTGQFSIQQANASQSGFLTSTDWSTFNAKQAALGFTPLNPANNLSDVITPATARTNLGLAIGTNVQAWSARLDDIVSNFTAASNLQVIRKNAAGTALEFATVSGGSGLTADTWTITSGSLAANASAIYSSNPGYTLILVRSIGTTFPARVRIYPTNAYATADQSRLIGVMPVGKHGCLMDVVTTSVYQSLELGPPPQLYAIESPIAFYVTITNLDTVTRTIPAAMNIYR
jgi:hypothetical protein